MARDSAARPIPMGRNLSTSSPMSYAWESGTGGPVQCLPCPLCAARSQDSCPRERGCYCRAGNLETSWAKGHLASAAGEVLVLRGLSTPASLGQG